MHILPKRRRSSGPVHIARALSEQIAQLNDPNCEKKTDKLLRSIEKHLEYARHILCDVDDSHQLFDKTNPVSKLSTEFAYARVLPLLITNLHQLTFESKKKVSLIFINLMKRKIGFRSPAAEVVQKNPGMLMEMLEGYECPEIAPFCGIMLRECSRHEPLARALLETDQFYNLFTYIETPSFEISADAFSTFKSLMQNCKRLSSNYLQSNYERFFSYFQILLTSDNYLTRRQALKLLSELLKEELNEKVAERFFAKMYFGLQIFLDHPKRSPAVNQILVKNREKLVMFVDEFLNVAKGDASAKRDKQAVLEKINRI
ncbi:hypothetical protein QR680_015649 [Steinernema hermaphroditum]|uniref:Mo25-like protein n=1 Tax=Steinernema hermaphroditum TaxID=289476 RepID=A0AA39HAF4_9BILA|nr:hypothetical protein QR680_015649 [Steinernema hermaphroditum]